MTSNCKLYEMTGDFPNSANLVTSYTASCLLIESYHSKAGGLNWPPFNVMDQL